jgi:hypothetical protein
MPPDGLHTLRHDWRRRSAGLGAACKQAPQLIIGGVQLVRSDQATFDATEKKQQVVRTPQEQTLIDQLNDGRSQPLTWQEANLAVVQAFAFGLLDEKPVNPDRGRARTVGDQLLRTSPRP